MYQHGSLQASPTSVVARILLVMFSERSNALPAGNRHSRAVRTVHELSLGTNTSRRSQSLIQSLCADALDIRSHLSRPLLTQCEQGNARSHRIFSLRHSAPVAQSQSELDKAREYVRLKHRYLHIHDSGFRKRLLGRLGALAVSIVR
jgi:hypothetical protein